MFSSSNANKPDTKTSVDIMETIVYKYLKTLGFRKYGRTLHRFVDGDISQVIHFQNGCPPKGILDILWINLGIRVPECAEKCFVVSQPQKKYYHEYECNIRTRLGPLVDKRDTWYDLNEDPGKIGEDILEKLKEYVLPVFEVLNSRESILRYRNDYASFDQMNHHLLFLEEAMIYGRNGNTEKASELFNRYYNEAVNEYQNDLKNGSQIYLRKGEYVTYLNGRTNQSETILAEKSGYVTLYNANSAHLKYLEELADKLSISLHTGSNSP